MAEKVWLKTIVLSAPAAIKLRGRELESGEATDDILSYTNWVSSPIPLEELSRF